MNEFEIIWKQISGQPITLIDNTELISYFQAPRNLAADATLTFSLEFSYREMGMGPIITEQDIIAITVIAGVNDAPTAYAGGDGNVAEGATVTLRGRGTDPKGETLTYAWTQLGGRTVTLNNPNSANPTFTAPVQLSTAISLSFSLIVTNESGLKSPADKIIIVVNAYNNDPPTSNAGEDQTVDEEDTVTLRGSGTDPEGETLRYVWIQTGDETVTLSDARAESPTFTAPRNLVDAEVLTFQLTVIDARGLQDIDTVVITVTAGANDAPTANAGNKQYVDEGTIVTLDGSDSFDPENEDLTYAWTQSGGTPSVLLSGADTPAPTFTAPDNLVSNTDLEFSLTVADARGLYSPDDTVVITVIAGANDPPRANAGHNQNVYEGVTVTLNGGYSYDPENERLTYVWTQTSSTFPVLLSGADTFAPTFTAPENLVSNVLLEFKLAVIDARGSRSIGNSLVSSVEITVIAGTNNAPIADAGDDQTVAEGATVTLDGSDSSGPENENLTYAWTQSSGTPSVLLSGADTSAPTFTAPDNLVSNAVLEFSLTVTDARRLVSADTVTITVTANEAPTANAGDDQNVVEGTVVMLDGSSSFDPENENLAYAWTQSSGTPSVLLSGADTSAPTFTALDNLVSNTVFEFSLTVTDARGLDSPDDTVVITVIAGANDAPTANAGDDQNVDEGTVVMLDGSSSFDPENENLTYAWTQSGGTASVLLSGADTSVPTFTAPDNLVSNTVLEFSLTVTDARGLDSPDDTVVITVIAGVNDAPTANAGDDQNVVEGTIVMLDGSASFDPENENMAYAWTQSGGTTSVLLSGADTSAPTFTAPDNLVSNTVLEFSLTVTDARRLVSDADTVTITVTAGVNNTLSSAGDDRRVIEISIWPNPTSGVLNITVCEKVEYKLLNTKGQILREGTFETKLKKIDISSGSGLNLLILYVST